MKKNIFTLVLSLGIAMSSLAGTTPVQQKALGFTPNRGQVTDQNRQQRPDVLYGGQSGELAFHLKTNGISYQLSRTTYKNKTFKNKLQPASKKFPRIEKTVVQRLDINWLGANTQATLVEADKTAGYANFYTNGVAITRVPSYKSITYKELYHLIDLHYYNSNGELEYDFIVSPGADYKNIRLQINGAEKIKLQKNGDVVFYTPLGNISEAAPKVYQSGRQLTAKWVLRENVLSFEVQGYNSSLPMIIDPVSRIWGTYYGGSGDEGILSTTHNSNNDVIGAGISTTAGGTIIATAGAYQTTFGGGMTDAFLVKFDAAGVRQWATYFGGAGEDFAYSCASDGNGDIYISGGSDGGSGPVMGTVGSHQPNFGGGSYDAFLSKFSASGTLVWSSYYGGNGDEEGNVCSVDIGGNVYIAGYSDSGTGTAVATPSSHQPNNNGSYDGFLAKFNSAGVRQWGTYYGGTADEFISFCTTDPSGNVIAVGGTDSNSGTDIATSGGFLPTYAGGPSDGFVVKFNSAGVRQWGSYYGGAQYDEAYGVRADLTGNIFIVGDTESNTGLSTAGSHQPTYAFNGDAFVAKFDAAGNRLWGSYYGGGAYDDSYGCAVDANGDFYLSGSTETPSGSSIATPGSPQSTFGGGGNIDAYIVKFSSGGVRQWGSYYGGNGEELAFCSVDGSGNAYICGVSTSSSGTIIASALSHQTILGGSYDAFIAKFSTCSAPATPTGFSSPANLDFCAGNLATITMTSSGLIEWFTAATGGTPFFTGTTYTVPTQTPGTFSIYVGASDCTVSLARNFIAYTVQASPNITVSTTSSVLCKGETATLSIGGANTYSWVGIGSSANIAISPTTVTNYTAIGTGTNGCSTKSVITQWVTDCLGLMEFNKTATTLYPNPCKGSFTILSVSETQLSIFNALGQNVVEYKLTEGNNNIKLDEPAGVYFIRLKSKGEESTHKLIVE